MQTVINSHPCLTSDHSLTSYNQRKACFHAKTDQLSCVDKLSCLLVELHLQLNLEYGMHQVKLFSLSDCGLRAWSDALINYGVAGTIQDSIGGAPTRSIVVQVSYIAQIYHF
jgi:hypothetical protein